MKQSAFLSDCFIIEVWLCLFVCLFVCLSFVLCVCAFDVLLFVCLFVCLVCLLFGVGALTLQSWKIEQSNTSQSVSYVLLVCLFLFVAPTNKRQHHRISACLLFIIVCICVSAFPDCCLIVCLFVSFVW